MSDAIPEKGRSVWETEGLIWYLRAVGNNSAEEDFAYVSARFPTEIAPGRTINKTLDEMRERTLRDGHERWTFAGLAIENPLVREVPILVSRDYLWAEKPEGFITEFDMKHIRMWLAEAKTTIETVVAIFHSHPKGDYQDNFSPEDLYALVTGKDLPAIQFLAGPTKNLGAFRSQDSKLVSGVTQEQFAKDWKGRYKWRDPVKAARQMNRDIAREHRLAIYEGLPGRNLRRFT